MEITREEIAIHEAGHYVASALIIQLPGKASIVPDELNLGHVSRLGSHANIAKSLAKTEHHSLAVECADIAVFICVAGQMAVENLLGKDALGCDGDYLAACEVLAAVYDDEDEEQERYWYVETATDHIFADERVKSAVKHVADELLSREEIADGDEIFDWVLDVLGDKTAPTFTALVQLYPAPKRNRGRWE